MSRILVLVLSVAAAACAGSGAAPAASSAPSASASTPARRNPNVITKEELAASEMRSRNVLDAVRALRPAFLTERGKTNMATDPEVGTVHASLNGIGVIPLNDLRNIPASTVVEIQFLHPPQAMQRFGGAAKEGPVIVVKTM